MDFSTVFNSRSIIRSIHRARFSQASLARRASATLVANTLKREYPTTVNPAAVQAFEGGVELRCGLSFNLLSAGLNGEI